jgi:hypothetical protein
VDHLAKFLILAQTFTLITAFAEPKAVSKGQLPPRATAQNNETGSSPQSQPTNATVQAPKDPIPDAPIREFAASAQNANNLKNSLQPGVQNDAALTAKYQAATTQTAVLKAKLDEMAQSGKYDTRNYEEALAALSIPAQQFNYQPGKEAGGDKSTTPSAPTAAAQPETVTTQGLDLSALPVEQAPLNAPMPSNEIADTRVPIDAVPSRSVAGSDDSAAPLSPPSTITSIPGGVEPVNLNASSNTAAAEPAVENEPLPGVTQDANAPAAELGLGRGLASTGTEGEEPSDDEIEALVAAKVLKDHQNKLAAKNGKAGSAPKPKPSLADRLKNSSLNTAPLAGAQPDAAQSTAGTSAPEPAASLKDEIFWYGPQKFGRLLLTAVGADKNISGNARRDPNAVSASTASDWLQVILGWMAAASVMFSTGLFFARKQLARWKATSPDEEKPRREPTVK